MRAWNRAKLLWGYLSRQTKLSGLPVEYIVETTAKCNLYCPMCPRETHKQPKQDMTDEIFQRLVQESGSTAEHMMLIGLGEPFMDPKIFERIEYCERHNTSTLLSTNGTFLDEKLAERLLATRLQHITLSFDGATKESFEFYRKGARFEKVRDNFVRFARLQPIIFCPSILPGELVIGLRTNADLRFRGPIVLPFRLMQKRDAVSILQIERKSPIAIRHDDFLAPGFLGSEVSLSAE